VRIVTAATLLFAGAAASSADARESGFDPSLAHAVRIGAPRGGAPMDGLDAANSGQSRFTFPIETRIAWQARASGGIGYAPAADERGHIIVVQGSTRVAEFDEHGKPVWSTRLNAELASGVVLTSDNTRVVVTTAGEVVALGVDGRIRRRKQVSLGEFRPRATVIALSNGGISLADGRDVYTLDASLEVSWRARSKEIVRSLLEYKSEVFAVTDAGSVHRFRSETGFDLLGRLPGRAPAGVALAPSGELVAILDDHKLATFQLANQENKLRFFDALLTLRGPPAMLSNGGTRLLSSDGLLLFHDREGNETARVPLDPPARGEVARADRDAARLIVDARGSVAVAPVNRDALIVTADAKLQRIDGTACPDPLRPTPLAQNSLLFSCRSGVMWRVDAANAKKP
jgi:hypothetical protein